MSRVYSVPPAPSVGSARSRSVSSAHSARSSHASRRGAALVDRINELEQEKRSRRASHAGSLVLADRGPAKSIHDINHEIRALEAEKQAVKYETLANDERDRAFREREREYRDEYSVVEYRDRRRASEEIVLFGRRPREEVIIREKSPPRNVVRVEKDRKGRMALVKSSR